MRREREGARRRRAATAATTKARAAWVSIVANGVLIAFKLVVGIDLRLDRHHLRGRALDHRPGRRGDRARLGARGRAPGRPRHRYGHEKVENFSGVIEGAIIFAAAVAIVVEAVRH